MRNQWVHGSTEGIGGDMVEWAQQFGEAYRSARVPTLNTEARLLAQWTPPKPGKVKLNCDVGFIHPESYQVAVVARTENGSCVGWRTSRYVGQPIAVVGEARAFLEGLRFAQMKG